MKLDSSLTQDKEYLALPPMERAKVVEFLAKQDKEVMSLPDEEKIKVLNHFVNLGSAQQEQPKVSRKEFDTTLTTPEKIALGAENLANRVRGLFPKPLQMALPSQETANPILSGMATSYRNVIGEGLFPKQGESVVGQMLDPVALAAGGGAAGLTKTALTKVAPALSPYLSGIAQGTAAGLGAAGVSGGDIGAGAGMGAGIGAALPPVLRGAAWLAKYPYHLVERFIPGGKDKIAGRALNKAAGINQQKIVDELKSAGDETTAGQAAVNANSAEFSALQKRIENLRPTEYDKITQTQESGRQQALRSIGKDSPHPDAPAPYMTSAEKTRGKIAERMYGDAFTADDMRLSALLAKSMQAKGGIHQGTASPIPLDQRIVPITKNKVIMDIAEQVRIESPQFGDEPINNLRGLDRIKKMIDADLFAIRNKQPTALQNVTEASLNNAKSQLLEAMTLLSPKYGKAMEVFGERSIPINQMKIGKILENALSGTVGVAERGTVFTNKVNDAARIIANETGQTRYEKLSDLFTPEQMGKVNRIIFDLNRDARFAELAKKGMPAINKQLSDTSHEIRPPNWLDRGMQIANAVIRRVQGEAGEKSQMEIAKIMQNPKMTAKIMQAASDSEKKALMRLKMFIEKTPYIAASITAGTNNERQ